MLYKIYKFIKNVLTFRGSYQYKRQKNLFEKRKFSESRYRKSEEILINSQQQINATQRTQQHNTVVRTNIQRHESSGYGS
jgi:hypothetical protein